MFQVQMICDIKHIVLQPTLDFLWIVPYMPMGVRGSAVGWGITSRKVAGSIRGEVIGFFNWHNPSSRTMALESTQSLSEMSTRNLPGA
jgi:hypothetical protein